MMIEARLFGSTPIIRLAPARQSDEQDSVAFRLRANSSCNLIPVHFWHTEIKKYNRWLPCNYGLEGRFTIIGDLNLVADRFEEFAERKCSSLIVINDQDPATIGF